MSYLHTIVVSCTIDPMPVASCRLPTAEVPTYLHHRDTIEARRGIEAQERDLEVRSRADKYGDDIMFDWVRDTFTLSALDSGISVIKQKQNELQEVPTLSNRND